MPPKRNQRKFESKTAWPDAAWDSVPAYQLSKETVDSFLQAQFGYYDFYTGLNSDHFQFWILQKLTQDQRAELFRMQYGSTLRIDPSLPPKSSHRTSSSSIEIIDSEYDRETTSSVLTNQTLSTSVSDTLEERKGLQVIGDDLSLSLRAARIRRLVDAKKRCSTRDVVTTYEALESTRNFLGWSASVLLYIGCKV